MSKVFFCSDLHFHHLNILKYERTRREVLWQTYYINQMSFDEFERKVSVAFDIKDSEFLDTLLQQHDQLLIDRWNNVVGKNDIVWFLGDLYLGKKNDINQYVSKLQGTIKMIRGNHDKYPDKVYYDAGIKYISNYPILLKQHFILSHAPIDYIVTNTSRTYFYNIFGHVHSSNKYKTKNINSTCVCVERFDLKPTLLYEFDSYMEPEFKAYEPDKN